MKYKIRFIFALILFALEILGICGLLYFIPLFNIQLFPLISKNIIDYSIVACLLLIFIFIFTFVFGRLYCSLICPFGILQEIISVLFKVKNKNIKDSTVKYFITAIAFGLLFSGCSFLIKYFNPYSYFSSIFKFSLCSFLIFAIISMLVFYKNRYFCKNICPVGYILSLISRFSLFKYSIDKDKCLECNKCVQNCPVNCIDSENKKIIDKHCITCMKCVDVCSNNAIEYKFLPKQEIKFNPKRRKLLIATGAIALFGIITTNANKLKNIIIKKIENVILPPGAVDKERVYNNCIDCKLCVNNCPNKIIKEPNETCPIIHIDYSKNYCEENCNRCSQVCPNGTIKKLSVEEKQKTKIASAVIDKQRCMQCGLCYESCKYGAIKTDMDNNLFIDNNKCIGCGACKIACEYNAIKINAIEKQNIIM